MKTLVLAVRIGALGLALLESVASQAEMLWDNGDWDGSSALSSERKTLISESWTVDDAIFSTPVSVRQFQWFSVMYSGFVPVATDLIILDENFNIIQELHDLAYTMLYYGSAYQIHNPWRITIPDLEINLPAGRYFFGGRPVGSGNYRAFTALNETILGTSQAYFKSDFFGYPDWVTVDQLQGDDFDCAFNVQGEVVPEPRTAETLFGALSALLFLLRGRSASGRRRKMIPPWRRHNA